MFAVCFGFVLVAERQNRQRAEFLAQQVEAQAATLERARIAREIHDSLGHSLTTLDVQLELARQLLDHDRTQASNALAIAHQLAGQCLQDVRHSVQALRQHDEVIFVKQDCNPTSAGLLFYPIEQLLRLAFKLRRMVWRYFTEIE